MEALFGLANPHRCRLMSIKKWDAKCLYEECLVSRLRDVLKSTADASGDSSIPGTWFRMASPFVLSIMCIAIPQNFNFLKLAAFTFQSIRRMQADSRS